MWSGICHLTWGNAVVGIIEAIVVILVCRPRSWRRTFGFVIIANYLSALIGYFILVWISEHFADRILGPIPVAGVAHYMTVMILIAIALTLIIEWPVYFVTLRFEAHRRMKTIVALFAANAVSYALIISLYWLVSSDTVSRYSIKSTLSPDSHFNATVYFLSPDDGDVYQMRLNGSSPRKFALAGERSMDSFVHARSTTQPNVWKLSVISYRSEEKDIGLAHGVRADHGDYKDEPIQAYLGPADDFRSPHDSFEYFTGVWAREGLIRTSGSQDERIAVELPFLDWPARKAAVLRNDIVLFQLGNQLLLADFNEKSLTYLGRGRGPLVLMDSPAAASATTRSE